MEFSASVSFHQRAKHGIFLYLMKLIALLLIVLSFPIVAADQNYKWLQGIWIESYGDCPTTLEFEPSNIIKVIQPNTTSIGTYEVTGKAVLIPKSSNCWNQPCLEMKWDISKSVQSKGCGNKLDKGVYEYINILKVNDDTLEIDGRRFVKQKKV